jgi:hypothetical protein
MDPSTAFTNKMLLLQYANSLKGEKPVGQASWYDSLGVELFGSEYNTPVGQKKMADWVKEHPNEAKLAQYNYTLRNTAPYAPTMQTGTGFQQMPDTKHPGGIGVPGVSVAPSTATPVKDVSGQPVGKALDANSIQELEDSRTTYQIMSEIKDTFEKPEFAGQTGPIQGMWNKIKVKFMQDGDIQYAINQLESLITIAYSLTGKQASYNEMQNLKKALLPQLTQPHANFMATLNATQNWLQKNYTNRVSGYKQSGYSFNLPDTIDNKKSQTTSRFSEGGKTWNIPADKIQAFKANHPNAKEVR